MTQKRVEPSEPGAGRAHKAGSTGPGPTDAAGASASGMGTAPGTVAALKTPVRLRPGDLAILQRAAGNRAVSGMITRSRPVQREAPGTPEELHTQVGDWYIALTTGKWADAAVALNKFEDADIKARVSTLSDDQVENIKVACPAALFRVRTPLLDRQYRAAIAAKLWDKAVVYLNGFNDDDIHSRLKELSHDERFQLFFAAQRALQGASQHRITDPIGIMGTFKNEIKQEMTEGVTTVVRGQFTWTLIDGQLQVFVPVSFVPDSGITVPIGTWQSQIDKVWNQFAVVEPGGRKVPITMGLWDTPTADRKIKVVQNIVPGSYGCTADKKTCDRANAGKWYPIMPDDTAPHEFGHLIGLPDEYQRTHGDYKSITGGDKTGPANAAGKAPLAIAKELHVALFDDDETKRSALATQVLVNCGLIVGGVPQQGDFAQSVMAAYDDEYGGIFTKYLLEAIQKKVPENQRWTLLTVFSYASTTVMGNPDVFGAPHTHPVEARHLREFLAIIKKVWPTFTWSIGPK